MTIPPPARLHEILSAATAAVPKRTAVVSPDGVRTTFQDLDQQTHAVAAWTAGRSEPGDRVAVVADNGLPYVQLYYGVPRAGRVLALVNQRLRPAEQLALIASAEPRIVVGEPRHLEALPKLREQVPSVETVVALGSAGWQRVLDADGDIPRVPDPSDPAWLLFTSGSTGPPKGVVHTHGSLTAAVGGGIEGRNVREAGTYLLPFPMCHIAGYNVLVHHAALCTVVLVAQFRPATFVDAVNTFGVSSCSLAPTMLHAVLTHLEDTGAEIPTLRAISYGSAAVSADLIRRATERLDVDFHQGYGMTETGGNVTFLGPADHRAGASGDTSILLTAGRPHSRVEVRVVDDAGHEVPLAGTGEIVVRGEQVMAGYWRDEAATAATITDGWMRTGDVGRFDDAGRLAVVDRRKDVIITGGENVSSREVEDVLSTHPAVDMVAVVGVPDDYWGEAICAVVVAHRDRRPDADELIAYVRDRITPFKRPRHVLFVDQLPLTTNGKVAKDVLRRHTRAQVRGT